MKKLFIFDCFGVVLDEMAPVWFSSRFGKEEGDRLKIKYFSGGDKGEKSIKEIIQEIERDLKIPRKVISEEWASLVKINRDVLSIIENLKKKHTVYMLSNAPVGVVDRLLTHLSIDKYFDKVFISGEMHLAKPEKEAYLTCLKSSNEVFDEVFMIDDNPANLVELEQLNITPILFEGSEKLKKILGENI